MHAPITPLNEAKQLKSPKYTGILDTSPEGRFDRITRLARRVFNAPIALVSLVDRDRQWFKSRQGLSACETGREISFCGHAVLEARALVVCDALQDPRFLDNPLALGPPNIRFYAGRPIHSPDGSTVGTLCVIDQHTRTLSLDNRATLADLAAMVDEEFSRLERPTTDQVTSLSNRRGFVMVAHHALAKCRRMPKPAVQEDYADMPVL